MQATTFITNAKKFSKQRRVDLEGHYVDGAFKGTVSIWQQNGNRTESEGEHGPDDFSASHGFRIIPLPTYEQLSDEFGKPDAMDNDGTVYLYKAYENEYVVLSDNTVITRQEDNAGGPENAFFPYPIEAGTTQFNIRLDNDLLYRLRERAGREGRTVANLIKNLLNEAV